MIVVVMLVDADRVCIHKYKTLPIMRGLPVSSGKGTSGVVQVVEAVN